MKKKLLTAAVCAAMSMALCACNTTDPTGATNPTEGVPQITGTVTEAPATPSPLEEAYAALPVTNYDEYVESTSLPEGYLALTIDAITEADVDVYVQEVREGYKERVLKETALENGDIAIIDFTGYIDGATFEGGSKQSHEVELGSGSMIPGFEEGLIGAKKGDAVVLNLKFPEDYYPELAGKDVTFEVKIRSSAAQVLPEFTDEFVAEITDGLYSTTADFRMYAKEFLIKESKNSVILDYLAENTTFEKFNDDFVEKSYEFEKMYYIAYYGFGTEEEFDAYFGKENTELLWEVKKAQIRRLEQERLALYCVAMAEGLTVSDEEFDIAVTEYAQSMGMTMEQIVEEQGETYLRQSVLMEKAMEHLLDSTKEVEKEAE